MSNLTYNPWTQGYSAEVINKGKLPSAVHKPFEGTTKATPLKKEN